MAAGTIAAQVDHLVLRTATPAKITTSGYIQKRWMEQKWQGTKCSCSDNQRLDKGGHDRDAPGDPHAVGVDRGRRTGERSPDAGAR